jgi:DNA-binding phage protein
MISGHKMPFFSTPEKKQLTVAQAEALAKGRGHKPSRVVIPANAPPLVKHLFSLIDTEGETITGLCRKAGVSREFLTHARKDTRPSLEGIEACFGALGYVLVAVPAHWNPSRRIDTIEKARLLYNQAKEDKVR